MAVSTFVLDASVALGALFKDEQDAYSLGVLQSLDVAVAVVPALWHLELGNILSRALKAGRISAGELAQSWERLETLSIQVMPTRDDACYWAERSVEWQLSAYDCCYLDLARERRMPLATREAALAAAARRHGVRLYMS
ncbi:MAG: type II toxin-antitoxin system VapC family toxin [Burkholderiaceae bacterium]